MFGMISDDEREEGEGNDFEGFERNELEVVEL